MTRTAREVQLLLGPLDPIGAPPVEEADRQADLRHILAQRPARRTAARARRWAVGAAALLLVTIAGYQLVPSSAGAATPPILRAAGGGGSAASVLVAIADRAVTSAPPARTGGYEHQVIQSWNLWTQVDGERVTSAVVPTRRESWRGPDNSGRVVERNDQPQFPAGSSRWRWLLHGAPGNRDDVRRTDYAAGGFSGMWPGLPPIDGLREWLAIGHPASNGPAETLVAVTDLARDRVLTPAVRAEILRILAALPGLTDDGEVVDRAGRTGRAFSLVSDYSGLPTRYTLVVDAASGKLLDYEQTLTTTAGKLDVRVPAVIGYETYLTADYVPGPG
jgi:hypothetical protein